MRSELHQRAVRGCGIEDHRLNEFAPGARPQAQKPEQFGVGFGLRSEVRERFGIKFIERSRGSVTNCFAGIGAQGNN
jgi:hypothetical protein